MEEVWKKFHLSKEEKGVLAVNAQEVVFFLNNKLNSVFFSSYKQTKSSTRRPLNPPFNNFGAVHVV